MAAILSKNIWHKDKNVEILNGPVFEWSGPAIAKAIAWKTIWKLDHLKSDFQKSGFQVPTVYWGSEYQTNCQFFDQIVWYSYAILIQDWI